MSEDVSAVVDGVDVAAYTIPTDDPEADGTLSWDSTTMVCVQVSAADVSGLGWTYAPSAAATYVEEVLRSCVIGRSALAINGIGKQMRVASRNAGLAGLAAYAISAVDVALWDLKAKVLGVSLAALLGTARDEVPVYGSGGFTTYDESRLDEQLQDWMSHGMNAVKIKIGEQAGARVVRDLRRVDQVCETVGPDTAVFVDANGGYRRKQAVRVGRALQERGVVWFEEPVSSQDKEGLAEIRGLLDIDVAAGEYANDNQEFRRLCEVVDCLQVDASRCGGITGWLRAGALASSYALDVSGHCAPYLHLAVAAATPNLRHLEWFHDHVRIEQRFLEGTHDAHDGVLTADHGGPGHGYELRAADLTRFRVA